MYSQVKKIALPFNFTFWPYQWFLEFFLIAIHLKIVLNFSSGVRSCESLTSQLYYSLHAVALNLSIKEVLSIHLSLN